MRLALIRAAITLRTQKRKKSDALARGGTHPNKLIQHIFRHFPYRKKKQKIQTGVIACYLGEKPLVPLFSLISSPLVVFTSHSSVLLSVHATLDRSMHELEHMCVWVGGWVYGQCSVLAVRRWFVGKASTTMLTSKAPWGYGALSRPPALGAQISGRIPALRGINPPFPSSSSYIMFFEFVYLIRPLGVLKRLL